MWLVSSVYTCALRVAPTSSSSSAPYTPPPSNAMGGPATLDCTKNRIAFLCIAFHVSAALSIKTKEWYAKGISGDELDAKVQGPSS